MKKLFTLLIMACAFLVGNAQTIVEKTFIGQRYSGKITNVTNESAEAKFSLENDVLFTISTTKTEKTQLGTIVDVSSSVTIGYDGESKYTPIQLGGQSDSNGGANFTPVFGENVKTVSMWTVSANATPQTIKYNGNSYTVNVTTTNEDKTLTIGELVEIPLENNLPINLGNYKLYTLFVITYEETLPVEISDFNADIDNLTSDSAEISVTYSATNVSDETTFTLYYKDHADPDGEYSSIEATSTGGTISLSGLTAETEYTYDIYLAVNGEKIDNATASPSFTTLFVPTAPWSANYAEEAIKHLSNNTAVSIKRIGDNIAINDVTTKKFAISKDDETFISENDVTSSSDLYFRRYSDSESYAGIYPTVSSGKYTIGVLNLKEGDVVEIAYKDRSTSTIGEPTSVYNLTQINHKASGYILTFEDGNNTRTLNYDVYKYTVNTTGKVSLYFEAVYCFAYIKVNPDADVPDEPTPAEDVLYLHFTDEDGKYDSTHAKTLPKNDDGLYKATLDLGWHGYFVLADANFPQESVEEYSIMTLDNSSDWASLGNNATIYSLDDSNSDSDSKTSTVKAQKVSELNSLTPFKVDFGKIYDITLAPGTDGTIATLSAEPSTIGGGLSGVDDVVTDKIILESNLIFNVYGQPVDETYKGIVIRNGKKYIQR